MIKGYKRKEGQFGIRNKIILLSSVCCVNSFIEQIAKLNSEVVPITHQHGCDLIGEDREQVLRTLVGTCNNPNVGGILLIGLGCESTKVGDIISRINCENKIVKSMIIQELGSRDKILELGKKYIFEMKENLKKQKQEEFDISNLVVGLECGASDPFSGITANPAVGLVSDKLVKSGATVILSEIPEMIGAENVLSKRINNEIVKTKLFQRIKEYVQISKNLGCDLLGVNPTPGNIKSGLSSIEEKSLGCIAKAGNSIIQDFIEYAESPTSKGLIIMNTPGNDPESVTGIAAGGAQVILFTTGLGTPIGNPIVPIIKISTNHKIYKHMRDFLDLDAGEILEGINVSTVADKIYNYLIEVCNGKETASEKNGCREFAINRLSRTF